MNWEDKVRRVEPYVAGEQPGGEGVIKLNTNECPYPPAPGVIRALERIRADYGRLRLYPDMHAQKLVNALADYYHVRPSQIFVGVGSDDVLALAFLTFFNGKEPILFPDITYSFYDVWAELFRIPYRTCPLDENFRIRKEDYFQANGGIVLPNPNAPTGVEETVQALEEIVAASPDSVVIIDEAYVDFGAASVLPLVERYRNLMVVQTFSKSRAMAGARIGFAIADEKIINYLKDVKFSFNSYTMNLRRRFWTTLISGRRWGRLSAPGNGRRGSLPGWGFASRIRKAISSLPPTKGFRQGSSLRRLRKTTFM